VKAYHTELYETKNIKTIGWIDVESKEFVDTARNTIARIYPTCAEGGGSSAISCMHARIIPILSHEASVDIPDCGYILPENSIEDIKTTIQTLSAKPSNEIKIMSKLAWKYARANHTKETFSREFNHLAKDILPKYFKKQ